MKSVAKNTLIVQRLPTYQYCYLISSDTDHKLNPCILPPTVSYNQSPKVRQTPSTPRGGSVSLSSDMHIVFVLVESCPGRGPVTVIRQRTS